jgi:hypothetical protein
MRTRKTKIERIKLKAMENPNDFFARFLDKPLVPAVLFYVIQKCIEQEELVKKAQAVLDKKSDHARKMVEEIRKFEDRHRDELEQITGIRFGKYADEAANYFYHFIDENFFNPRHRHMCFPIDENSYVVSVPELKGYSHPLTIKEIAKDLKTTSVAINESIKILINKRILDIKKVNARKYYKIIDERYIDHYKSNIRA